MSDTFLVTGVLGCLGAWAAHALLDQEARVVGYDLGTNRSRLALVLGEREEAVQLVQGDITDLEALERALDDHEVTHVVHLAALQVPFCRADPPLGARVNVVGTANVFEAVRRRRERIGGVAYASSAAVYGPGDKGRHGEHSTPGTHYGVYKQANEGTARIYWEEHGLPSTGLRPFTVYGPGRDQGLTSGPTLAMLAASRGEGFHISFGGSTQYHYARDVGASFVAAARAPGAGASAHNLPGPATHMSELVEAIEAAAPDVAGRITFEDEPLPFPAALESDGSVAFDATPLERGVRETIEHFRAAARSPDA